MTGEQGLEFHFALELSHFRLEANLVSDKTCIAIVGPSGAGKSTLLRVLAGLERRSTGLVRVGGVTLQNSEARLFVPPWKRHVGYVPQDVLLFPHLTALENLMYCGAAKGDAVAMAEKLALVPFLSRAPRRLSGGERQRVALGRALLTRPKLLVLDEPFSALDRPLRQQAAQVLCHYGKETGTPIVLVSHDEHDVESLAQEVWTLNAGQLANAAPVATTPPQADA